MKSRQLIITKINASWADTFPLGMSRIWVRGFFASMWRSRYLLKAMAEFRAKTMHSKTSTSNDQLNALTAVTPRKKPIIANGKANIEWANSTNEKYFFM